MKIRPARPEDRDAINVLLTEHGLPASDITHEMLRDFVVAEGEGGFVVGSVGLERYDSNALLRSLAVAPTVRNAGMGSQLLAHAESLARDKGILELWLLTTTAPEFFRRKDYVDVKRSTAPAKLQATTQFAQLCPARAVCMRKIIFPR
ncbi:amino-acid N-acetyltransferase [Paraburkholderia phenoliruptrix]|uniref:arsenic resistance N-acetyltransferase ArsN2 n=1 Tax=Paraburkholderia phenoliruptrix TaxID=252970 RepID=UPI00285E5A21|nr:arsenic resistance N-acetyltransferase ArsN2 [Paraburkholderia phenoliruptrix]MDR6419961.1 amino-acid N-acetyltransferase [Paraburkholderia phenoliruptrix]